MAAVTFDKAYTSMPLTNISLAYLNETKDFIAEKIFPTLTVNKVSGTIYSYGKQALRIVETKRAVRSAYNSVEFDVEKSDHYLLQDYGLTGDVFDEDIEDAEKPVDAEADETEFLTQMLLLDREKAALDQLNTTNFGSGLNTQLSGTSLFSDYANSDPFKVIQTAVDTARTACGKMVNNMVVSYDVFSTLINHPKLIERFPGSAVITHQMLQDAMSRLFGIKNLHLSTAQYNNSNKGATTEPLADLLTKKIFLYYSETPKLKSLSLGKTYSKRNGLIVGRYGKNMLGKEALASKQYSMIMANWKYDQVIVESNCGHLIYDVIA